MTYNNSLVQAFSQPQIASLFMQALKLKKLGAHSTISFNSFIVISSGSGQGGGTPPAVVDNK